jgi:hypothetical protein
LNLSSQALMKRFPVILWLPGSLGALFTGIFVASWAAYFWGDGDGERAGFCTVVAIFAIPLLVGSIQLLRRRPSGLRLLRFGAVLFACTPRVRSIFQSLEQHPDFIEYMTSGSSVDG